MKKLALSGTVVAALLCTSCLGTNKTFNSLHEWNRTATSNRWANEGIFFAGLVFQVYTFVYLADVVVFNSIEFWEKK